MKYFWQQLNKFTLLLIVKLSISSKINISYKLHLLIVSTYNIYAGKPFHSELIFFVYNVLSLNSN